MSETAKKLFESLKGVAEVVDALAPGLKNIRSEGGPELQRLGTQGAMELASVLFNQHGFVPYGPGQYTPDPEHLQQHEMQQEHGREGRGMER